MFYFNKDEIKVNNDLKKRRLAKENEQITNITEDKKEENKVLDTWYYFVNLIKKVYRKLSIFEDDSKVKQTKKIIKLKDFFDKNKRESFVEVVIENRKTEKWEILKFNRNSVYRIINRIDHFVSEKEYDNLGLIVEKDDNGNIINVIAKDDFEFSGTLVEGEPVGNEKNNLDFSNEQKDAMLQDTGATGIVEVYLDDYYNTAP